MKTIRDAKTLFGMLESGQLNRDMSETLLETQGKLLEMSNDQPGRSFAATVKLELKLTVKNGMVEFNAKIPPPKLPDLPRRATVLFLCDDGNLSTEHPQQLDLVGGPREIAPNRRPPLTNP